MARARSRAHGAEFEPRATVDPISPISGAATASRGPARRRAARL